jgi:hypothetical protein
LIVEVPTGSGAVHVSVGDTRLVYEPQRLARLRRVYLAAIAVAIFDRGRW